jgi:predicted  nucleic acid-binding Zn-ribbon protein
LNPKIEKLEKEIDRTKAKIAEMQAKLRKLEEQKTELENTDYVAVARSFHLTPQELADFLKLRQAGSPTEALPREQEEMNED